MNTVQDHIQYIEQGLCFIKIPQIDNCTLYIIPVHTKYKYMYFKIADHTDYIYRDQMDRFPVQSSRKYKYIHFFMMLTAMSLSHNYSKLDIAVRPWTTSLKYY